MQTGRIHPGWDVSPSQSTTHTHTPSHTHSHVEEFSIATACYLHVLDSGRKPDNPEPREDPCDLWESSSLSLGFNQGPWENNTTHCAIILSQATTILLPYSKRNEGLKKYPHCHKLLKLFVSTIVFRFSNRIMECLYCHCSVIACESVKPIYRKHNSLFDPVARTTSLRTCTLWSAVRQHILAQSLGLCPVCEPDRTLSSLSVHKQIDFYSTGRCTKWLDPPPWEFANALAQACSETAHSLYGCSCLKHRQLIETPSCTFTEVELWIWFCASMVVDVKPLHYSMLLLCIQVFPSFSKFLRFSIRSRSSPLSFLYPTDMETCPGPTSTDTDRCWAFSQHSLSQAFCRVAVIRGIKSYPIRANPNPFTVEGNKKWHKSTTKWKVTHFKNNIHCNAHYKVLVPLPVLQHTNMI